MKLGNIETSSASIVLPLDFNANVKSLDYMKSGIIKYFIMLAVQTG
jgi:hypothetical protein